MIHLPKTIAISAVLVAAIATTTGLLTALSMSQTAFAAVGTGGGCGVGGGSAGACISSVPFIGGGGNGGNIITGSGGGGTGFGVSSSPTSPLNHCAIAGGGSVASGGFHVGGSC